MTHHRGQAQLQLRAVTSPSLAHGSVHQAHVGKEGRGLSCTGVTQIFHFWFDSPYFEGVRMGFTGQSIYLPTHFGLSCSTKAENIAQSVSVGRVSFRNSLFFPHLWY